MATDCGCEAWKENTPKINGAIAVAANHGIPYDGLPYIYCPWCGTKILGPGGVAVEPPSPERSEPK